VGVGVTKFKAALDETQPDAATCAWEFVLREIAVSAVEVEALSVTIQAEMHMAGGCRADAVLKRIFDERNENVRGYVHLFVGNEMKIGGDFYVLVQTKTHEGHIVLEKLHFAFHTDARSELFVQLIA